MKVVLTDKYVNNQNQNKVEATINIDPELEEAMTNVKFYLVKADGTLDTNPLYTIKNVPAYTSKIAIKDTDNFNLSSLPKGVSTIKIVEGASTTGKVLGEFTVEKHTDEIDAAKLVGVKGMRPGSTGNGAGSVSFEIQSEVKIVKAYYKVVNYNASNTTKPTNVGEFKEADGTYAGVINVTNNKVENAPINLDSSNQAYDVYFILEDEYGSISTHICNSTNDTSNLAKATIPSATYTANTLTITKVEMPNLEEQTSTASAKVTIKTDNKMKSSDKFKALLYKKDPVTNKEEVIDEAEISGSNNGTEVQPLLSVFTPTINGAGEYWITVFAEGNDQKAASATVKSNVVTVSPIASVSNVEFTRNMGKGINTSKLSWKTPHYKLDIGGYDVYLSSYDQTAKAYKDFKDISAVTKVSSSQTYNTEDNSIVEIINPSEIQENTLYKAQVVAKVKTNHKLSEADSLPEISQEFFKLENPVDVSSKATSSEATLELTSISSTSKKDNTISGKVPTYKVEVYTINPEYKDGNDVYYVRASQYDQAVEVNKSSGRFTVKGLTGNTDYAIRLVATVQGEEGTVTGKSDYVTIKTKKEMINIVDAEVMTYSSTSNDSRNNKIYVHGNIVSINGTDYDTTKYVELSKVANIVSALKAGDHITYDSSKPNQVDIAISTTDRTSSVRTLPADVKDMIVNIKANSYDQTIATTDSYVPAEVNITGQANGSVDIKTLNAKDGRIVITNAKVKAASKQRVVVAAGSTVEFDGYYTVKASAETPVTIDSKTIDIAKTDSNNLSVTGFKTGLTATVSGTGTQGGAIILNGKANVTVTPASGVTVASDVTVTAEDGKVDLSNTALTGHQNVTIKYTKKPSKGKNDTVKAVAATAAPFKMTNLEIKHYDYDNETDHDALIRIDGVLVKTDKNSGEVEDVDATKANFDLVNRFLDNFKELIATDNNGKTSGIGGATITVNANSKDITITFTGDTKDSKGVVQSYNVSGLR